MALPDRHGASEKRSTARRAIAELMWMSFCAPRLDSAIARLALPMILNWNEWPISIYLEISACPSLKGIQSLSDG